jgi:hypothetical protein
MRGRRHSAWTPRLLEWFLALGVTQAACSTGYYGPIQSDESVSDAAAAGLDKTDSLGAGGASNAAHDSGASGNASNAGTGGTGANCASDGEAYTLGICDRLESRAAKAQEISEALVGDILSDCRLQNAVQEPYFFYLNAVTEWTLDLWGCLKAPGAELGVNDFELLDARWQGGFSRADANELIRLYVGRSALSAELGPAERDKLRFILGCLAKPRITNSSDMQYELSVCDHGDGGAAGAGGFAATDGSAHRGAAGGT